LTARQESYVRTYTYGRTDERRRPRRTSFSSNETTFTAQFAAREYLPDLERRRRGGSGRLEERRERGKSIDTPKAPMARRRMGKGMRRKWREAQKFVMN